MKRISFRSRSQQRQGVVLFVVVIVVALVSLAAYGFVILMQSENRAAHLAADQMQVEQIAESGNAYLRVLAAQSRAQRDLIGGWHHNPSQFQDLTVDADPTGTRHGRFSIVCTHLNDDVMLGGPRFGVENASTKLSLEALLQWDDQFPGAGRTALMQLPEMTETLADSLLDWIDADDVTREFGAESDFYLGLDPPRQPPNRLPSVLEELLDVQAIAGLSASPTASATRPQDRPVDVPPEPTGDRSFAPNHANAMPGNLPWWRFLTLHSAERNESYDGQPRINLNHSDLNGLYSELSARFGDELAKFVVALRLHGPSQSDSPGGTATAIPKLDLTITPTYELSSPLEIVDAAVAIPTSTGEEESTELFTSPLSGRGDQAQLVDFCDQTTTRSEPVLAGRININEAPREVLLAIPQFPREAVEQLIAIRGNRSEFPERRHAAWLLVEGVLDRDALIPLLPFITTGGDVIDAQVVAYYDDESPWARHRIVLDGTSEGVPALYFRDLSRLGRGYRFDQLSRPDSTQLTQPRGNVDASAPVTAFNNP